MELKFDENGLIPAIVQDHYTKEVLTLAYMNAESLAITIDEGRTCFWSRSRRELWRKGETSGNVQHVVSITADCDGDALDWAVRGVEAGAGEIVLNSIDTDGVKQGFDLEMLDALAARVHVPIVASGGAGKMEDFAALFTHPGMDAGLAASIFHTRQVEIRALKEFLRDRGVAVRL